MTRISSPRCRSIDAGPTWSARNGSITPRPASISRRITSRVRIIVSFRQPRRVPGVRPQVVELYEPDGLQDGSQLQNSERGRFAVCSGQAYVWHFRAIEIGDTPWLTRAFGDVRVSN